MKKVLLSLVALAMAATMSAQVLLQEGFDNGIPSTWTMYNDNNDPYFSTFTDAWIVFDDGDPAPSAFTTSYFNSVAPADRWLITPAIVIPAGADVILSLEGMNYGGSQYPETFTIKVSTTGVAKTDFTTIGQFTPGAEWEEYATPLASYAGQTIHIAFVDQSTDQYAGGIDNVFVGVQPSEEIKCLSASMPTWSGAGQGTQISVTIQNKGTNNLTSFTAAYSVDGGTAIDAEQVTNINVAYNGTYTYTFNAPFVSTVSGLHTIDVIVNDPNGLVDADLTNNTASTSTTVYDASNAVQRTSLLEHFTTAKCPNCPPADQRLEQALEHRTDVIWLAHHAGYYTDPMTCSEDEALMVFYNDGGSTYAPAMMLDRSVEFGENATTPLQFPGQSSLITSLCDNAVSTPSFASVAISNVNFDAATRKLTATVSGNIADGMIQTPRLSLYLMEDSILYTQSGASGKIHHMHVMRHAISNVWGDDVNTGDYSQDYTYTVPEDFKMHKCKLIAFVSNYSNNVLDRRIMNATQTSYINAPYVGIDEVAANVVMNVYPNPTSNLVNVTSAETIREVRIVNTLGQEVYANTNVNAEALQVNTQNFAAGMYMVVVKTDNGIANTRLNVVR